MERNSSPSNEKPMTPKHFSIGNLANRRYLQLPDRHDELFSILQLDRYIVVPQPPIVAPLP